MLRYLFFFSLLPGSVFFSFGQNSKHKVFTSDIDHFWKAYDSARTTTDTARQRWFIENLYISKGTEGLRAFMEARDYTASLWVDHINRYPRFWNSIRPNTLSVKTKAKEIENSIKKLKGIYPELKEARIYFTIGGLNSGGTTKKDMVLIGTEIATGTAATDVSEFEDNWLAGVFKEQQPENIVPLNIHEYVHTQQKGEPVNLLGLAIHEGACDFITELVMGKPLQNNYIRYGRVHEPELKERFKEEMFTASYANWLYNGTRARTVADLGYFMGYTICKAYYRQAAKKRKAVKDIIQLDYSDSTAVERFLSQSGYFTGPLDKAALRQQYESKRPTVLRLEPFTNGDTAVDTAVKELTIVFSKPMFVRGYSINNSERGKAFSPITGVSGYSETDVHSR